MRIVDKYLSHYNLSLTSGNGYQVLLPFLTMDMMQQIFYKEIFHLPMKHEMNKAKKTINREYHVFNTLFWNIFDTQEDQDEIIDIMDEYSEFIRVPFQLARNAVMNDMGDLSEREKRICSAMNMCNILAKLANIYWSNIFALVGHRRKGDIHITEIENATKVLFQRYFAEHSALCINQNLSEQVNTAMNNLISKMVEFVKSKTNDKKEETENKQESETEEGQGQDVP